jgi:hypothetical protein
MIDMKRMWSIGLVAAVIGVPGTALAVPKGPAGQTCKSSGTTTVNGKEEGTNKPMTCTADTANTMNAQPAVQTSASVTRRPLTPMSGIAKLRRVL